MDVLQPCVTFNRAQAYDFYRPRVYKLEEDTTCDPTDLALAFRKAQEWGDRIPIGIFYRTEDRLTYEEMTPALAAGPLVKQPMGEFPAPQIEELLEEFR